MHIIGINGFKRSGKGEVGKAIEALVPGTHTLGFADKLKILAARSFGFIDGFTDADRIALMDEAKECWVATLIRETKRPDSMAVDGRMGFPEPPIREYLKQLTVRKYLQNLGNDARIVFGEDFWVDQVLPIPTRAMRPEYNAKDNQLKLKARYHEAPIVAFTDLRYENEAQRILDLGGFNIEVVRPGVDSDGHASEQPLPNDLIDYQIVNNGTLENLRWEVNKVLELSGVMK